MKKLSLLVLIGFLCINSFAQKIPYMTKIDKQELKYMDKNALSLMDWSEYMFYIKDHYGETSEQYIATIPNIEKFNSHYKGKYSIVKIQDSYNFAPEKGYSGKRGEYPIIGLTTKQMEDYCKWRTEIITYKVAKKHKIIFTIPREEDYQKATNYKSIKGVKEGKDIGYRCIAKIVQ